MYGLIDCNNFFVSCERVMNPSLNGRAVVVLSGNDGCVISRSNEAKALGIPMGCPAFQICNYTNPSNVVKLSARHALYGDLSRRVMSIIGTVMENLEIYSIDETFFTMPYNDVEKNHALLAELVKKIYKWTGIPVSSGFAPTHTLAKIASHIAKKDKRIIDGVYWLIRPDAIDTILRRTPIDDVWGIGRKLSQSLCGMGVYSAAQFAALPSQFVKNRFSVTTERVMRELKGEDCINVNPITIAHKSIMNSRTFGNIITDRVAVCDAVMSFADMCAKRLRDERSVASSVSVYLRGDPHRNDIPYYSNVCQLYMLTPSSSTMVIAKYALIAFNNIFREGMSYRKAGVMVSDIMPDENIQLDLFDKIEHGRQKKLMEAVDTINNKYGRKCVQMVPQTLGGDWHPQTRHTARPNQNLRIYSDQIQSLSVIQLFQQ